MIFGIVQRVDWFPMTQWCPFGLCPEGISLKSCIKARVSFRCGPHSRFLRVGVTFGVWTMLVANNKLGVAWSIHSENEEPAHCF